MFQPFAREKKQTNGDAEYGQPHDGMQRSFGQIDRQGVKDRNQDKDPDDIDRNGNGDGQEKQDGAEHVGAQREVAKNRAEGQHSHDRPEAAASLHNLKRPLRELDDIPLTENRYAEERSQPNTGVRDEQLERNGQRRNDLGRYGYHEEQDQEREQAGLKDFITKQKDDGSPEKENHGDRCKGLHFTFFCNYVDKKRARRNKETYPCPSDLRTVENLPFLPEDVECQGNDRKPVGIVVRVSPKKDQADENWKIRGKKRPAKNDP